MSKYCDECKQFYPDDEPVCPHCVVILEEMPQEAEQEPPVGEPVFRVDLAEEATAVPPGEPEQPPDLPVSEPYPAEEAVEEEATEVIDLAALTEDTGGEPDQAEPAESAFPWVDGGGPVEDLGSDTSGVDLASLAQQAPGEEDSAAAAPSEETEAVLDELAQVEASSAVNLEERTTSGEQRSGRDLIAEAVESGVDLAAEAEEPMEAGAEAQPSELEEGSSPTGPAPAEVVQEVTEPGEEAELPFFDLDRQEGERGEVPDIDLGDVVPIAEQEGDLSEAEEDSAIDLGGPPARKEGPEEPRGIPLGKDGEDESPAEITEALEAFAEPEGEAPISFEEEAPALEEAEAEAAAELARESPESSESQAETLTPWDQEPQVSDFQPEEAEKEPEEQLEAASQLEEDKEEPEEQPEPEEEAPPRRAPKPGKAPSRAPAFVGGGLFGAVVGAGTCVALWFFGIEPPSTWRSLVSPPGTTAKNGPTEAPVGPTYEAAVEHLKHGDFAKALPALDAAPEPTAEMIAQRGSARWLQYVQQQKEKNAALSADEPLAKQAGEDLNKAAESNNPEAVFYRAQMKELTGKLKEAQQEYQRGLEMFKDNRAWRPRFQAALDRLAVQGAEKPAGPVGQLNRPDGEAARALVLLLTAFQAETPAPGDADSEEAGGAFWKAVKLAQEGKYDEALQVLAQARKVHDQKRFSRLRKAQNPFTDPTENIFLECCDQLMIYWQMCKELDSKEKVALKDRKAVKAIADLLLQKAEADKVLAAAGKKLEVNPDKIEEAIDKLLQARQDAEKRAADLETRLAAAKKDIETATQKAADLDAKLTATSTQLKAAEGKLKGAQDRLANAGVRTADVSRGIDQLAEVRDQALHEMDRVANKLEDAKYLAPEAGRAALFKALDLVVTLAQVKDPVGRLVASEKTVKQLEDVLARRPQREELLDAWLPLLMIGPCPKTTVHRAMLDAETSLKDPETPASARVKALAIQGLIQRQQGDLAGARQTLARALSTAGDRADWQAPVQRVLTTLTDPAAYYLPRARESYDAAHYETALALLDESATLFPRDGTLLALRSHARLDLAHRQTAGKLEPSNPALLQARKDAEAAAAAGVADGHYAAGRIAEDLGNLAEARQNYQRARDAHPGKDETGSRYRMALARVLLKLERSKPAGGYNPKTASRSAVLERTGTPRHPLAALILMQSLAAEAGPPPAPEQPGQLADEVLASKEAGFADRAQALAIKGLWTKALQTYAEGLRLFLRREHSEGLLELIRNHPGLKRPDSLVVPEPLLAESHYSSGLRHYTERRYADAEREFTAAIEASNQDARFFYFLGLTRLALDRLQDAQADFEQGSLLEMHGSPGRAAVSAALERIQGRERQTLNRYRP